MSITSKEKILKVLAAFNPWWTTGAANPMLTKAYKRFAFHEAMKILDMTDIRRIVVLTGTRRVGKTTIQYQMIEALLSRGVPARNIVFISMDHPMLKLSDFSDILECYHENICPNQNVYYFFDEIQYAQNWDQWLKTIYDTQPETRIVATGSASPALVKGKIESGAGRWSVISVPTMSFYEYCELLNVAAPDLRPDLKPSSFRLITRQEQTEIMLKLSEIQKHFIRYLQVGGFPELALSENDIFAQQLMRDDVVDKVLKRDLLSLYNIRSPIELERIFLYLCSVSSELVNIETLTKELQGVSRPTVENYIQYLESANLIYQSWPVGMTGKKILKSRPKIYIADAAIRNAVLMDNDMLTDPMEMGKIVETAVYKHVSTFYYQQATSVGYFRGSGDDKEIDIVVEYPSIKNMLIEVKYRDEAPIPDNSAICQLSDRASVAFVITKRADDFGLHAAPNGMKLIRIPAFAFLYLLGHAEKNGYKGER
ncbi:MAG: ATP-binding protein [Oscillospiraceae bacterium]|nr:ATP-binding protein [Oscillospiraceae bacterium]